MVISDKYSLLNDIPAICRLLKVELVNVVKLNDLYIFFIKNKKWEQISPALNEITETTNKILSRIKSDIKS
jgi:hypothetical protein